MGSLCVHRKRAPIQAGICEFTIAGEFYQPESGPSFYIQAALPLEGRTSTCHNARGVRRCCCIRVGRVGRDECEVAPAGCAVLGCVTFAGLRSCGCLRKTYRQFATPPIPPVSTPTHLPTLHSPHLTSPLRHPSPTSGRYFGTTIRALANGSDRSVGRRVVYTSLCCVYFQIPVASRRVEPSTR
jgi:hypothetical protein